MFVDRSQPYQYCLLDCLKGGSKKEVTLWYCADDCTEPTKFKEYPIDDCQHAWPMHHKHDDEDYYLLESQSVKRTTKFLDLWMKVDRDLKVYTSRKGKWFFKVAFAAWLDEGVKV